MSSLLSHLISKWSLRLKQEWFPQRIRFFLAALLLLSGIAMFSSAAELKAQQGPGVYLVKIEGPITPASEHYLRGAIEKAHSEGATLLVVELNTPGGLLNAMQRMVENLLEAPIPTVVYVSPSGGGAISAGVFITLAAHVAVMAPGTTIGAAHPVLGSGEDMQGDMREKLENFTVSLVKAIAEQRGRNVQWAEKAVRESVAITDREALSEKVIDFVAADLNSLLEQLEGRTVSVRGENLTLANLKLLPRQRVEMNFKQQVVNLLSDPNIAVLLGLGALLGIGIELFHPGGILPGVFGVICLILSLTASQVVPISIGGVALLGLGMVLLVAEMFVPAFGALGIAGIGALVLGAIYYIDTDDVWSGEAFGVSSVVIGGIAAIVGAILLGIAYLSLHTFSRKTKSGKEGFEGKRAVVSRNFELDLAHGGARGKVELMGEIWNARIESVEELPVKGEALRVVRIHEGLTLLVVRAEGE